MQLIIEKMLVDFERGGMTRRQLALSLAALVSSAQAAPKQENLRAVTLNHVTVRVPDVRRTSQFYQEFFGCRLSSIRRRLTSSASARVSLELSRREPPPVSITMTSESPDSTPTKQSTK